MSGVIKQIHSCVSFIFTIRIILQHPAGNKKQMTANHAEYVVGCSNCTIYKYNKYGIISTYPTSVLSKKKHSFAIYSMWYAPYFVCSKELFEAV